MYLRLARASALCEQGLKIEQARCAAARPFRTESGQSRRTYLHNHQDASKLKIHCNAELSSTLKFRV